MRGRLAWKVGASGGAFFIGLRRTGLGGWCRKSGLCWCKGGLLRNGAGEMFGGFFPLGRDLVSAALCFAETARWRTYAAGSDA